MSHALYVYVYIYMCICVVYNYVLYIRLCVYHSLHKQTVNEEIVKHGSPVGQD